MGVGGLEILPILLAEVAEVVSSHGVPAEVGHGLEILVERRLSEFGWDDSVTTSLAYKEKSSKYPASEEDIAVVSSRTLFGLANLHRDIRKRNLNRPWSRGLLAVVIFLVVIAPVHHVTVDAWVDVGVVRVDLTGAEERVTVPGLAVASSGVSASPSLGVCRRDGILSVKAMWELVVSAKSGLLGRG